jgi:hypothetical protein
LSNIATNPWSFTSADVATTVVVSSIVNNSGQSALVTTGSAHGYTLYQFISLQGTAVTGYNGGYKVLSIPSTTTFLIALEGWQALLANAGAGGNSLSVAYNMKVRGEQITWQDSTASSQLTLTDVNGNLIWTQNSGTGDATYTYGKPFWFDGLVINALPNGTVLITVN